MWANCQRRLLLPPLQKACQTSLNLRPAPLCLPLNPYCVYTVLAAPPLKQTQVLPVDPLQLFTLAHTAVGVGVATVFVGAVPRWFCFVCPIVLGLLAPLVINAGVGGAAELACKTLQLPDDECVDLW